LEKGSLIVKNWFYAQQVPSHYIIILNIYKEPCMDSYNTRMRWLTEILHGHWTRCVNMFSDATTFQSLCFQLENQYRLKASRRMCVFEKVRMFLYTIALGASNREVQERF
jgi:hypothetical protein